MHTSPFCRTSQRTTTVNKVAATRNQIQNRPNRLSVWSGPLLVLLLSLFWGCANSAIAQAGETSEAGADIVYELRIYHAHPSKFEEMLTRFREHTLGLFAKHGMTNVAYFVPPGEDNSKLVYFLAYPSREAREKSWQAFLKDPVWQAAYKKSHENGPLVKKHESLFLKPTDYSPTWKIEQAREPRLLELRTYLASEGNLPALHDRFRQHTLKLFEKHGMTNLVYFELLPDQPEAERTLIYLIAHPNEAARQRAFQSFAADPDWKMVRAASEEKAGGSLTAPGGVMHEFLLPTDFSPFK